MSQPKALMLSNSVAKQPQQDQQSGFDNGYMEMCSDKTLQSSSEGFFMDLVRMVEEKVGQQWIDAEFGRQKTDKEQIKAIYEKYLIRRALDEVLANVHEMFRPKNASIAEQKQHEALDQLRDGQVQMAVNLMTQGILRAPPGKMVLHLLWHRSAALLQLNRAGLALSDLHLCMDECILDDEFKANIFARQAQCYKALGNASAAKKCLQWARCACESPAQYDTLRKQYDDFKVDHRHRSGSGSGSHSNGTTERRDYDKAQQQQQQPQCHQSTQQKVSVRQSAAMGRHFVASEPIRTGDILVREQPYAACLFLNRGGTHCHHCFRRLEAAIACRKCSGVAFCGQECRDTATSTYHRWECPIMDVLIGSGMSVLAFLALRMVTQVERNKLGQIWEKRDNMEKVYSLCTNDAQRSLSDCFRRTIMAAFLFRCLCVSGYFGRNQHSVCPATTLEFRIAELLLFHLKMLQMNAHEIYETMYDADQGLIKGVKTVNVAVGVYPNAAFFNHDCDPAVVRYFDGKSIVVRAVRPLAPGEPVCDNYGRMYVFHNKNDRQKWLWSRYWFRCKCQACTENWPSLMKMAEPTEPADSMIIRCSECQHPFSVSTINRSSSCKCPQCQRNFNIKSVLAVVRQVQKQFDKTRDDIPLLKVYQTQKIRSTADTLCPAIDNFFRTSRPPNRSLYMSQEALRSCWATTGNIFTIPPKKKL